MPTTTATYEQRIKTVAAICCRVRTNEFLGPVPRFCSAIGETSLDHYRETVMVWYTILPYRSSSVPENENGSESLFCRIVFGESLLNSKMHNSTTNNDNVFDFQSDRLGHAF